MPTAFLNATNNYRTTLNGAITDIDTEITVTTATGSPDVPFHLSLIDAIDDEIFEIVKVTAKVGPVFTVTRAQGGTSALAFDDLDRVVGVASAEYVQQIVDALTDGTGDFSIAALAVSGNVDGRDVSVDGTKLDGIEAGADVTDATNVLAALAASAAAKDMGGGAISNTTTIDTSGNVTVGADLAVNGADITTDDTTFNLLNATATTINFGGGATTAVNIGHASGTVAVAGALTMSAGKTVANLSTQQAFTAQQYFAEATLTDAATISWNLQTAQTAKVTLGGNRTLDTPTNMVAGATYILRVIQDGTGTRTLAYHADYLWPSGTDPVVAAGANDQSLLTFYCTGTKMLGVSSLDFS